MTGAAAPGAVGRRRFIAPARAGVDRACFAHPLFAAFGAYQDLMGAAAWPEIGALDQRLRVPGKQLVEQNDALLADGLHYEQRIARGQIATRARNWHDLFNALVWARYPALKAALNARQCQDIERNPPGQRTRAQAALTQFDETGVIVRVRDASLLQAWDRHDWHALFVEGAMQWRGGDIAVSAVFGHALMEQALLPTRLLVGKCLVVQGDDDAQAVDQVAQAIARGDGLNDPLELRPLPLMGIPGWHVDQDEAFYQQVEYFRPARAGREYPAPAR
ncbi:DUF3025 domain-containing protein [Stenotrophomonas bentonitica]